MYIKDIKNLECNIVPEGNKFLAYVDLGKDENGKRIRPKVRGRSEDEAAAKLEKKLREMGFIQPSPNAPTLDIIVNQFTPIPDFVREYRVNFIMEQVRLYNEYGQYVKRSNNKNERIGFTSRTAENYFYSLKPFEDYFYSNTLGEIDTSAINQFFRVREAQKNRDGDFMYSQVTLNRIEFVVSRMFKRAVDSGWISSNPFNSINYYPPISRKVTEKVEGLSAEELNEFLNVIHGYPIIYSPIMLMLNTGMRTQEVLALKWKNIDMDNNIINIQQAVTVEVKFDEDGKVKGRCSILAGTKTKNSNRQIGLTEEAKKILLDWRNMAPSISKTKLGNDDFVFGYERKPNFTYNAFRDKVNDCLGRVDGGIDKMRLHRFRHTVGTLLAAEGREVLQIMRQLGITQEKTLQRYIDKKGNKKIMDGNTQAISEGLSDLIGHEPNSTPKPDLQEILQKAEGVTDDTAKIVIKSLLEMIQREEK